MEKLFVFILILTVSSACYAEIFVPPSFYQCSLDVVGNCDCTQNEIAEMPQKIHYGVKYCPSIIYFKRAHAAGVVIYGVKAPSQECSAITLVPVQPHYLPGSNWSAGTCLKNCAYETK